MTTHEVLKEYIWLVTTIYQAKKLTLAEINEKWCETEMSGGLEFSRATFTRHKEAIQDIFGLQIECDRRDEYRYYIANKEVLRNNSIQNWMLSTMSVGNVLSESMAVKDRILMERVPSDGPILRQIIKAMKKNIRVLIEYQRYGAEASRQFDSEPYCVKLFGQRWYVLAHVRLEARDNMPEKEFFSVFSIDRIRSVELTDRHFTLPDDFDAAMYFKDCYGIVVNDLTECETVVLRAYDNLRFYLQDLPLHHSQKKVGEGEDYIDFEYQLRPTIDFLKRVQSEGCMLQVLEPDWVADEIMQMHMDAADMYAED